MDPLTGKKKQKQTKKQLLYGSQLRTGSLCPAPSDLKCLRTQAEAEPPRTYPVLPSHTARARLQPTSECDAVFWSPAQSFLWDWATGIGNSRHRVRLGLRSLNLDVDAFGVRQESNRVCKSTGQDLDALISPQFYFRSMPFTPVLFWTVMINFSGRIMALYSHDGGQKY